LNDWLVDCSLFDISVGNHHYGTAYVNSGDCSKMSF